MTLQRGSFENIIGKEENADDQHFLLCPHYFLSNQRHSLQLLQHLNCGLQLSVGARVHFCCLLTPSQTSSCFYMFAVKVF